MRTEPEALKRALAPYRESVVVGAECMFSWYWVADWCREEGVEFVLGHALYMKAIHGGKAKNDRIDSEKIARLLRGGTFPLAHVYPKETRGTRDLLRRRNLFVRRRAELLAHVQNTFTQYNVSTESGKGRDRILEGDVGSFFDDPSVGLMLDADVEVVKQLDETIAVLEAHVLKHAKVHDPARLQLLRTIPGVGKVLSLVMLYEIQDVDRFDNIGQFASYARLVVRGSERPGHAQRRHRGNRAAGRDDHGPRDARPQARQGARPRPAGRLCQGVGGQEAGIEWPKDWQRTPQVGFQRGDGPHDPQ
jgi:transposase